MMIPLVVDHYEHNDLIIELKEMDQNGLTKSRNSMKVCIFKPSFEGTLFKKNLFPASTAIKIVSFFRKCFKQSNQK